MEACPDPIREYWGQRAAELGVDPRANTPDPWIHQVEARAISEILRSLPSSLDVLDLGCANGHTTFALYEAFPTHRFLGGDFSPAMVEVARQRLDGEGVDRSRLDFAVIDMLDLTAYEGRFDVVLTVRGLINLPDSEAQWKAIGGIARALKPGGTYIAVENFRHAQENLNRVRATVGLPPLPYRWHNCWFEEAEFRAHCEAVLEPVTFEPITSTYYLLTRVVYSKLCQLEGREPDYDHPIYQVATELPPLGEYGPVKLSQWVKGLPPS